jgi:hypothetical protein
MLNQDLCKDFQVPKFLATDGTWIKHGSEKRSLELEFRSWAGTIELQALNIKRPPNLRD